MSRETDIAWAAGLFEGEGSITFRQGPHSSHMVLSLAMTDEDVVRRYADILAATVVGPYQYVSQKKPYWACRVSRFAEVQRILDMFQPYLGTRRQKRAQEVLDLFAARFDS